MHNLQDVFANTLKSEIFLFTIHLLTSETNFFTHYTNPILLVPCLSHRDHQLCHIIRRHPHSLPTRLPFTDSRTFCDWLCSSVSVFSFQILVTF